MLINWLLEIFNELLMFSSSSRLKLDNIKLYIMLQDVNIDEVSNFFNISFKNKLQYKLLVISYLFVFQESIEKVEAFKEDTLSYRTMLSKKSFSF